MFSARITPTWAVSFAVGIGSAEARLRLEERRHAEHGGQDLTKEQKTEIISAVENANNFSTKAIVAQSLNLKPLSQDRVKPQSDQTVRMEITLNQQQFEKWNQVKSLLSHKVPSQNSAEILEVVFDFILKKNFGEPEENKSLIKSNKGKQYYKNNQLSKRDTLKNNLVEIENIEPKAPLQTSSVFLNQHESKNENDQGSNKSENHSPADTLI